MKPHSPDSDLDTDESGSAHRRLARLMGLVVALRFLNWGGITSVICALLLLESSRYPQLLSWLTIPVLFAFYLLASGQVLLMIRLADWPTRLLALGPCLSLVLLMIPAVRSSASFVALALGVGLWLYLRALLQQTQKLDHRRAHNWFARLAWAVVVTVLLAFVTQQAAAITLFAGMFLLGALLAGWRIWLLELRLAIAAEETALG